MKPFDQDIRLNITSSATKTRRNNWLFTTCLTSPTVHISFIFMNVRSAKWEFFKDFVCFFGTVISVDISFIKSYMRLPVLYFRGNRRWNIEAFRKTILNTEIYSLIR